MYFDKQSPESVLESAMAGTKTMIQVGDTETNKTDAVCIR
jgi:hypothetical protein